MTREFASYSDLHLRIHKKRSHPRENWLLSIVTSLSTDMISSSHTMEGMHKLGSVRYRGDGRGTEASRGSVCDLKSLYAEYFCEAEAKITSHRIHIESSRNYPPWLRFACETQDNLSGQRVTHALIS